MFLEQTPEYTITSDDDQWILIWHPEGIKYQPRKGGGFDPLPKGRRSFFSRLSHLVTSLLERKARGCENMKDLAGKIDEFNNEIKRVCNLERGE